MTDSWAVKECLRKGKATFDICGSPLRFETWWRVGPDARQEGILDKIWLESSTCVCRPNRDSLRIPTKSLSKPVRLGNRESYHARTG